MRARFSTWACMQVADSGPGNDAAGNAEARARARQGRKRIAVAAEALANAADVRIVDVPKSDAVFALLGAPCRVEKAAAHAVAGTAGGQAWHVHSQVCRHIGTSLL